MNLQQIKEEIEQLTNLLPDTDDTKFDIIYGVAENQLGFHMIMEDYPNYFISFLGATFLSAEIEIQANWT